MQTWAEHLQSFSLFNTISTANETGLDYHLQKVSVRVARVAKRLKS